jgi:ABC-type dipeptide/oligopeptide/nickel transport system ATPase component
MTTPNLLEIHQLSIRFRTDEGFVDAVKNVSFSLKEGASLAIVGESGSGKSVTALSLTRLLPEPPAEIVQGDIIFRGEHVLKMDLQRLRAIRGGGIAYIFQEPSLA